MMTTVTLALPSPSRYLKLALGLIAATVMLSVAVVVLSKGSSPDLPNIPYKVFWVGKESNVPTFVNFGLIAIAAALLLVVAQHSFRMADRWRWHWLGFGMLFVLMAFDEAAQVHEPVGQYLSQGYEIFFRKWIAAGLCIVAILALLGFNFIRSMEAGTRKLVIAAAAIYLGGALGLEMLSGYLVYNDLENGLLATLGEETMEMVGAAIFGTAALHQMCVAFQPA